MAGAAMTAPVVAGRQNQKGTMRTQHWSLAAVHDSSLRLKSRPTAAAARQGQRIHGGR
jgi:hypothetical protein